MLRGALTGDQDSAQRASVPLPTGRAHVVSPPQRERAIRDQLYVYAVVIIILTSRVIYSQPDLLRPCPRQYRVYRNALWIAASVCAAGASSMA